MKRLINVQKIRIGTRGSILAVKQAEIVKAALEDKINGVAIEIVKIKTSGDVIKYCSLADIGGKGLFLKEIERALVDRRIDLAVHSMKDIPAFSDQRLTIAGMLKREDPRDAFISNYHQSLQELPSNAIIGTCSPRRAAQLRSDLQVKVLRGNVNTRLKQAKNFDAIILAVCGLNRLDMAKKITEYIATETMLPAVGQGVICLQCHKEDAKIIDMLQQITHHETKVTMLAERAFLEAINGDCTTPLAAFARIISGRIYLQTMLADGNKVFFTERHGTITDAKLMGEDAARELLSLFSNIA